MKVAIHEGSTGDGEVFLKPDDFDDEPALSVARETHCIHVRRAFRADSPPSSAYQRPSGARANACGALHPGGGPATLRGMQLDFTTLSPRDAYNWMANAITPRPIAWVSTRSPDGKTNLAPFSFFNGVTGNPPTLMFSPVNDRHGAKKDTVRNIEATGEFVVNIVTFALAEKMNACAALLPYGESEFEAFGIAATSSVRVKPPRVTDAPVAFECTLHSIVPIGEGPGAANVVFGRIVAGHVSDAILGADGQIDPLLLDTIGRLGGNGYITTREHFELKRPDR